MNKNKILTTTIGSFPKPDYLPIMDWFDSARGEYGMNTVKTTIEYTKNHNKKKESDEILFRRAANEVINIQIDAGIDVPTDGEIRRENYIHYQPEMNNYFDETTELYDNEIKNELSNYLDIEDNKNTSISENSISINNNLGSIAAFDEGENSYFML